MAVEKEKVCSNCGYFTTEKVCPLCNSNSFAEKSKGKAIIFNSKESIIAEKLEVEHNGKFALKY